MELSCRKCIIRSPFVLILFFCFDAAFSICDTNQDEPSRETSPVGNFTRTVGEVINITCTMVHVFDLYDSSTEQEAWELYELVECNSRKAVPPASMVSQSHPRPQAECDDQITFKCCQMDVVMHSVRLPRVGGYSYQCVKRGRRDCQNTMHRVNVTVLPETTTPPSVAVTPVRSDKPLITTTNRITADDNMLPIITGRSVDTDRNNANVRQDLYASTTADPADNSSQGIYRCRACQAWLLPLGLLVVSLLTRR